jgi:general secretion pathway protein G
MASINVRGILIIAALCVLATVLLIIQPRFSSLTPEDHGRRSRAALAELHNLKVALDAFRADNGLYPTGTDGLTWLVHKPNWATNWRGPYLEMIRKDAWNNNYVYECPGGHEASGYPYDLLSLGPPAEKNPIVNWTQKDLKP